MNISHFKTMRRVCHIGKAASVALLFAILWGGVFAFSTVAYGQTGATMGQVVVSTLNPTITAYVGQPLTIGFAATGGQSYNGSECTVTSGPTYGWSASGGTVVPPGNTSTCSVSASFSSPGTYTVTASCTMGYTTNNCGNLSGSGSRSVTVNVSQATVTLNSVNWGGTKYAVSTDDGTYVSDGTGSEPSPDYTVGGSAAPVCFKAGSTPSCSATFTVSNCYGSQPASFTMSGSAGAGGSLSSGPVSETLTNGTITVPFSPTGTFASTIDNSTLSGSFSVSIGGGSATSVGSSSNPVYVVMGTPSGGAATNKRLNRVTTDCQGKSAPGDVVSAIWTKEISGFSVGPYAGTVWANFDGHTGECIDIVNTMVAAIEMTGTTSPGSIVKVYPGPGGTANTTGSTTRNCTIGNPPGAYAHVYVDHSIDGTVENLEYDEGVGSYGNFFEATYFYNNTYYPGGGTRTESSPLSVIQAFATYNDWYYLLKLNGQYAQAVCSNPGPSPETTW